MVAEVQTRLVAFSDLIELGGGSEPGILFLGSVPYQLIRNMKAKKT